MIGVKGSRIQNFLLPINYYNQTPTGEEFLRLRALGRFYFNKQKKKSQDQKKRTGESRFEMTFAIYNA